MLGAVSASEGAAWFEDVDYVAIEAYIPGDPGLDPEKGAARMREELAAAGHPDLPIVCILEFGDLPVMCAQFSHPEFGVQVWTVGAALNHTWPPADQEEPVTDEERERMQATIDGLVNSLGYVAGDLLSPVVKQRSKGTKAMQRLVAGIRREAETHGIHSA
jgi:hypothetical protein